MKYGARNKLVAKVKSIKKGDVMSLEPGKDMGSNLHY